MWFSLDLDNRILHILHEKCFFVVVVFFSGYQVMLRQRYLISLPCTVGLQRVHCSFVSLLGTVLIVYKKEGML